MEEYIPEKYTVLVLTKFFDRMKGFLTRRPQGCILLISPCDSIHTFGMRCNLDVAFFNDEGVIIRSEISVHPRRILRCRGARGVLEKHSSVNEGWYKEGQRVTLCI